MLTAAVAGCAGLLVLLADVLVQTMGSKPLNPNRWSDQ
jgi:hypothetical protein